MDPYFVWVSTLFFPFLKLQNKRNKLCVQDSESELLRFKIYKVYLKFLHATKWKLKFQIFIALSKMLPFHEKKKSFYTDNPECIVKVPYFLRNTGSEVTN